MKKITLLAIVLLTGNLIFAQIELSFIPKIGYNVVDIEKATGTSKDQVNTGSTYLDDWSTFNYGLTIEALFNKGKDWNFGGEITYNRLYYWEESYSTFSGQESRWGNVGTFGLGFLAKYNIANDFYFKPVISLEIFNDGSGVTIGTAFAAGKKFKLNDQINIPLEFRTDQIFGSAVSLLFGIGVGIQVSL